MTSNNFEEYYKMLCLWYISCKDFFWHHSTN